MKIYSRQVWDARPPRERTPQQLTRRSILFVHWSTGKGLGLAFDTFKEKRAAVRAIQDFHMDDPDRQYSDIAYGYVIVQATRPWRRSHLFRGRGADTVPASQQGANTGHTSVCVLMAPGEPLRRGTVRAIKHLYRELPCGSVLPHSAVGTTDCPGDLLRAALPQIRKAK